MTFREKRAWISFVTRFAVAAIYFTQFGLHETGHIEHHAVGFFLLLAGAVIVVEVALQIAIVVQSPKEARTPRDEREQLINLKATRFAFYVLLAGLLVSIAVMHHRGIRVWTILNLSFFCLVAAELTRIGSQIVLYRRDA